jgi:hypothetical protein
VQAPSSPRSRTVRRIAALAHAALAAQALMTSACTEDQRAIDPFPIRVDLSRGPMTLAMDVGDGPVPAILDTATPLTVIDPLVAGQTVPAPRRALLTVTLIGLDGADAPTIRRAEFPDTAALELHPCPDDGACSVGLDDDTVVFRGVIGGDVLSRTSARFDFPTAELRFFPSTSGDSAQLGDECQAVFGRAFAGGGTLRVAGTEVRFPSVRPVVGTCLDQAGAPDDEERGADAFMMVSTGLGVTVLATSAYERYAAATDAPALEELPEAELHLASGAVPVRLGRVGKLALAGSLGSGSENNNQDRGPCRELFLNRLMSRDQCNDPDAGIETCPCPGNARFCSTAAAVDLKSSIDVAVLDDGDPVLQSLRDELRPQTPELDGILGTQALASLRLEFDYLNNRMVMRCLVGGPCTTLPAVRNKGALSKLEVCRAREEALPDAGPGDAGPGDGGPGDGGPADGGPGDGGPADGPR